MVPGFAVGEFAGRAHDAREAHKAVAALWRQERGLPDDFPVAGDNADFSEDNHAEWRRLNLGTDC